MDLRNIITCISLFVLLNEIKCQKNPCPRILQIGRYAPHPDRWYGTITLTSDSDLSGVWLRMIFDKPFLQLGVRFLRKCFFTILNRTFFTELVW